MYLFNIFYSFQHIANISLQNYLLVFILIDSDLFIFFQLLKFKLNFKLKNPLLKLEDKIFIVKLIFIWNKVEYGTWMKSFLKIKIYCHHTINILIILVFMEFKSFLIQLSDIWAGINFFEIFLKFGKLSIVAMIVG